MDSAGRQIVMPDETPLHLEELLKLHPADLADRVQRLPVDEAHDLLLQLPRLEAGAVLVEMDAEKASELLDAFSPKNSLNSCKRCQLVPLPTCWLTCQTKNGKPF